MSIFVRSKIVMLNEARNWDRGQLHEAETTWSYKKVQLSPTNLRDAFASVARFISEAETGLGLEAQKTGLGLESLYGLGLVSSGLVVSFIAMTYKKAKIPTSSAEGVAAGHSGQFTPTRLPDTVIHTTLVGLEPATFRSLVRRATSSATEPIWRLILTFKARK